MPSIQCTCGEKIGYGEIPSANEWRFISDVEINKFEGKADVEKIYLKTDGFLKCPVCKHLWVFWDGYQNPPKEYVSKSE